MCDGTSAYSANSQPVNLNRVNRDNSLNRSKNTDDSDGSWLGRMVKKVCAVVKNISKTVLPDILFIAGATIFLFTGSAVVFLPVAMFYLGINIIRLVDSIKDLRRLHSTRT